MSKVKTGLVLEGGAMRGIFSAGVLDYMLKKDIYYDYVIGVSAGAGNAVNYVSRQEGRTKKIITHENAESYYGVGQLFENKKILNLEMLVAEYALKDIPYDFDTFFASKTECESVVVNCETGKAEYKGNFKTKDEFLKCQMASCSVPFICEPVEIDGYHYLDGSIIDSIPVERAVEKGCDKIVVVLTKPEGSKPTDYSKIKKLIEWSYKKYTELCEVMAHRRQAYDRQDKFMKKLVEEGKVFVIRPEEQMIRHFENNNEKLLQCYQYGYDTMRKQFKAFEKFMEDKSSPR